MKLVSMFFILMPAVVLGQTTAPTPSSAPAVEIDRKKIAKEYFETQLGKAQAGDAEAQVEVGKCYLFGDGVDRDIPKSTEWFSKAASQNNFGGQFYLGQYYEYWKKDPKEALKWYHKSADQGCATAQFWIGYMYETGDGVKEDPKEAFKWYLKAAENGDSEAQCKVGSRYSAGKVVTQDYKEAFKWFLKSAKQGYSYAMLFVGQCYMEGEGVDMDSVQAVKWFRKAAEKENARSQFLLAECLREGNGISKDEYEALVWYYISDEQDAKEPIQELEKTLPADKVKAAKKQAEILQKNIKKSIEDKLFLAAHGYSTNPTTQPAGTEKNPATSTKPSE